MRRHLLALRVVLGLTVIGPPCVLGAQRADTSLFRRSAASMFGLPGLVQVPSAAATPAGTVDFTYDAARQPYSLATVRRQRNALVTIGFLPWLTFGARGTDAENADGSNIARDLSASLQVRLMAERGWMPAIAVGAQDVGGAAANFESRFLVASKSWLNGSSMSVGYGVGAKILHGAFGGVGLRLNPWATALGEFDGHGVNGGLRLFAFPTVADRLGLQPRVDVVWRQDGGTAVGVGIRSMLGGRGEALARPTASRPAASRPAARAPGGALRGAARTAATVAAEQQLLTLGFENVRVAVVGGDAGDVIDVQYENRRYNRDELDALGIVMGVASAHADASVRRMRVTVRRVALPVLTVEGDVDAFVAFVDGRLSESSFAAQLRFPHPRPALAEGGAARPLINPSRWKVDLFVRPRVETQVYTDWAVLATRVTALLDGYVQLGPGLVLNARHGVPVSVSNRYWEGISNPNADRLLLHQAVPVPLGARWPSVSAMTQFSAGRFGYRELGFANETNVALADGRFSVGSTVALLGPKLGASDHVVALGTARMRFPAWDVTTSLTAGRFRSGDDGIAAELARQFGNTELAFYYRSSSFASVAGVRVSLPLTPSRELRPALLRVRAPEVHSQSLQSVVFAKVNVLRDDVGRPLTTDHDIARVYRTRDRLQPLTILAHVATLREASRRWVGEVKLRR